MADSPCRRRCMNGIGLVSVLVLTSVASCSAASMCVSGNLTDSIPLGADGCTNESNQLQDFTLLKIPFGSIETAAFDPTVTSSYVPPIPALDFTFNVAADAMEFRGIVVSYLLAGPAVVANTLSMFGALVAD